MEKRLGWDELIDQLESIPETWSLALLERLIRFCRKHKVFKSDIALAKYLMDILFKLRGEDCLQKK